MSNIIPECLKTGDKITIVSPAGYVDRDIVIKAQSQIEEWGFRVEIAGNALNRYGRYAGTAQQRIDDIISAINDKETKAILCSRGGYGSVQLIESIPHSIIYNNPKWLIGYSDITLLHAHFNNAGVASLHSPMCKHLAETPHNESSHYLLKLLTEGVGSINYHIKTSNENKSLNRHGKARGHLCGGNIAVFSALHGSEYDFNYDGAILFIEDIGESAYKIERMIYSLKLSGIFDRISGMIVGEFTDIPKDTDMPESINEMIRRHVDGYDFPIVFGFPTGHTSSNFPMPEGVIAELNVSLSGTDLNFYDA